MRKGGVLTDKGQKESLGGCAEEHLAHSGQGLEEEQK